jgi:hypothetical protein
MYAAMSRIKVRTSALEKKIHSTKNALSAAENENDEIARKWAEQQMKNMIGQDQRLSQKTIAGTNLDPSSSYRSLRAEASDDEAITWQMSANDKVMREYKGSLQADIKQLDALLETYQLLFLGVRSLERVRAEAQAAGDNARIREALTALEKFRASELEK